MQEIDLWSHLKQILLDNISTARPASGGSEVVMVCNNPDCNDRSGHLYIGMNNGIPMYHCKKCPNCGRVTTYFLQSLGIYDTDLAVSLGKSYKNAANNYIRQTHKHNAVYVLSNNFISDNELSQVKLAYINKRLGTSLTYSDLSKLKIVLNLYDLLESNNIKEYTRHVNIMDELSTSFIGFISRDNSRINMRNLREGKVSKYVDRRYINYNIFDNDEATTYFVPTSFDLNRRERTRVHIAEGSFDILSVYLNLRNREPGVYGTIQGNNYLSLVKYVLLELKLFYSEVHIYRDLGEDYNKFIQISQLLKCFNIPVYLHTNKCVGEKDFGISPDKIIEEIILL